jgi:hypothetical protein
MNLEQSQISKLERAVKFVDVWLFVDYVTACGFTPADAITRLMITGEESPNKLTELSFK